MTTRGAWSRRQSRRPSGGEDTREELACRSRFAREIETGENWRAQSIWPTC